MREEGGEKAERGLGRGVWRGILAAVMLLLGTRAQGGETADMLAVLDAGVEQWRQGLEFQCHYVLREGAASSEEKALVGEFGASAGEPEREVVAKGVLVKRGELMRYSIDYGKPPVDASSDGSGSTVTQFSFDEVSSRSLWLKYDPRYGTYGGAARFAKRPDSKALVLASGGNMSTGAFKDPFTFGGGVNGSPVESYGARPGYGETDAKSVAKTDPEHVTVSIIRQSATKGYTNTIRITFWTRPSPPVIKRIESALDDPAHGMNSVDIRQASRFVDCGGGLMMAQCVRHSCGPLTPIGESTPMWAASEWLSEDLGTRPPTDEDFVITIPADCRIGGLKNPPHHGVVQTLDITKFTVDDLNLGPMEIESSPAPGTGEGGSHWGLALASVAAIAALAVVMFLRRKRTAQR